MLPLDTNPLRMESDRQIIKCMSVFYHNMIELFSECRLPPYLHYQAFRVAAVV